MTLTSDEIARGEALLNKPLHAAYAWLYKNGRALIAAAKERDDLRAQLGTLSRARDDLARSVQVERGLAQSAEERVAVLTAEVERLRGLLRQVCGGRSSPTAYDPKAIPVWVLPETWDAMVTEADGA